MVLLEDTRQQIGKHENVRRYCERHGIEIIRQSLLVGDYMLTGPESMPKFSDRQLSFDAKKDIIGYVKAVSEERQPGGYGLGGFGPAPEGMAFWIIGMVAAIGLALWIGARAS